ncbi:N-acetylmuramoyl-L-alanine amidase [candidate division KSB1 bacterium]|nr:N-acetylmuramoyl-L-alanine amidase [candidate division KSB1 bacterium]
MSRYFYLIFIFLLVSWTLIIASDEVLQFQKQKYPHQIKIEQAALQKKALNEPIYTSPQSQRTLQSFNTILFNGSCPDSSWRLEVSYLQADGKWSPWLKTYIKFFKSGRFWAKCSLPACTKERIQYRILNNGIRQKIMLSLFEIQVFDSTKDDENEHSQSNPTPVYKIFAARDSFPRPEIVPRQRWGARSSTGTQVPHTPYRMTLHHTAMQRTGTFEEGAAEMRFIQDFHQNARGWRDIAYHFLVNDSGYIYQGVPEAFVGTHTGGANTGNIGLSMMGNFEEDQVPLLMLEACIKLFSYLSFSHQISPDSLLGHQDYNPTTLCPGKNGYVLLPEIRNAIRQNLAFGAPYIADPQPKPFSIEVKPTPDIMFHVKDDREGVDLNSIKMWIDGNLTKPTSITGNPSDYFIQHRVTKPLENSKNIVIKIEALDLATPPESLHYSYSFKIRALDLLTEIINPDSMSTGRCEMKGTWSSLPQDVLLTGLSDGEVYWTIDSLGTNRFKFYPDIKESGDYQISIAFSGGVLGLNARYRLINSYGVSNEEFIEYNSKFANQWGKLGNSPVYFESGFPSTGCIEILPIPDLPSFMIVDAFRFQKVDPFQSPAIPELKYIRQNANGKIEIAWFPALEGDVTGYRLYQSPDGQNWGEPIVDEKVLSTGDSVYFMTVQQSENPVYFQIVSVDSHQVEDEGYELKHILSEPSDTYGICSKNGDRFLIVDAFDRQSSWIKGQHFFVRSYGDALVTNGVGFESCNNDAIQTGEIKLNDYQIVIYFCGDDGTADESLSYIEQMKIANFLIRGGKLFISSAELGYDIGQSRPEEIERYKNIFKAKFVGDDAGVLECQGAKGTVFDGLEFTYGIPTEDTYTEDWPDFIEPVGKSQPAIYYKNSSKVAAIQYTNVPGTDPAKTSQLFYLAFAFETIYPRENRIKFMSRILSFFNVTTDIVPEYAGELPENYFLSQNFPNPFNPKTIIQYSLPQPGDVTLIIYNLLGQKVKLFQEGVKESGNYEISWDGIDTNGFPVCSGIYFYEIRANDFMERKKMVLTR